MKYYFMIAIALILAGFSSILTSLGLADLFQTAGLIMLIMFIIIDLGRFLLFNFLVDEWKNLRKIKYLISVILALLFVYSAVGIFSKLDSMVSSETREAMVNAAAYNKAEANSSLRQGRSEDLAAIAQTEYNTSIAWNKTDHNNCLLRAQNAEDIPIAENKCNNTKRRLDLRASNTLKEVLSKADKTLDVVEDTTQSNMENKSEIASILTTICKLTTGKCDTYDGLQNALTILILLVIVGTDYLQIAIVLAVNTRKNKPVTCIDKSKTAKAIVEVEDIKKEKCAIKPTVINDITPIVAHLESVASSTVIENKVAPVNQSAIFRVNPRKTTVVELSEAQEKKLEEIHREQVEKNTSAHIKKVLDETKVSPSTLNAKNTSKSKRKGKFTSETDFL